MKYAEQQHNNTVQRAYGTVVQLQQQSLVDSCQKELESFMQSHTTQDIAVWIMVMQNVNNKLLNKVIGIADAVVVE
jgi:DNA-binding protein Fis